MKNYVIDMICNYKRQNEIQNKQYKAYLKAKEEEMSDRNKRIAEVMEENKHYSDLRSSLMYAEAFVDGERSNERKRIQAIYNKLKSSAESEREIILMFGRTTDKVAKALEFYDNATLGWTDEERKKMLNRQNENKMTREEAEKTLAKLGTPRDTDGKYYILTVLEVLGLIKFDKPPKRKYIFFPSPDASKDNLSVYVDDAVKTMKEYGYAVGKHVDAIAYDCEIPNALAVIKDLQDRGYVIVKEVIPK